MHAAIVKEQGEFGWIMSTAIVLVLDCQIAVILDGESFVLVVTVKMLLCNVPLPLLLLLLLLLVSVSTFIQAIDPILKFNFIRGGDRGRG